MDMRRVILYAALVLVAYTLWSNWQLDYPRAPQISNNLPASTAEALPMPQSGESSPKPETSEVARQKETKDTISIKTDVLNLVIDSKQGDIISAKLLNYPVSVDNPEPITLLYDDATKRYVASSNLFVNSGQAVKNLDFAFSSDKSSYELTPDQKELEIVLTGETDTGIKVTKIYTLRRSDYLIKLKYLIANDSNSTWTGYLNTQLTRTPAEEKSSMFQVGSYTGASYSNPGKHRYKKVSFKDMNKSNLDVETTGGWVAMQQHYFLSAWIPEANGKSVLYTRNSNDEYSIGVVSYPLTLAPNANKELSTKLYLGPEDTAYLKQIAPGLEMTVDYGWLWFLSSLIFSLLKSIYSFVGNWGWAIVLVTVLIKLAFYRLSASSYKSMAGMRKLQPKLQMLKEKYGDDKAKISQATMELYRQEKVNPLGGCLPILIQIPVFIALYWVLLESVELRQAPFIFWIKDLATADPYHVLPIIMGGTMLIQQRLNPAPPDPMQAKVMMFLPVLFTALFWNFPAGLVLYWIVNNTLSILQQWYITRRYSEEPPKKSKKILASAK